MQLPRAFWIGHPDMMTRALTVIPPQSTGHVTSSSDHYVKLSAAVSRAARPALIQKLSIDAKVDTQVLGTSDSELCNSSSGSSDGQKHRMR
jgi:hypothetical protein